MRDCVGSWRLTQRVRGREGGLGRGVLDRAAWMVRQRWGCWKEAEGDREG